jgi:hypothetical protein
MVVGIDEPGRDQRAGHVLVSLRRRWVAAPDFLDEAVVEQEPPVRDLGARVVHGHDVGVRDERAHGRILA